MYVQNERGGCNVLYIYKQILRLFLVFFSFITPYLHGSIVQMRATIDTLIDRDKIKV